MSSAHLQAISVLVIEDESGDFGLIRLRLQMSCLAQCGRLGRVTWAKTLAEGISAAQASRPDIVLLDLSLPDSAGLDTVRAMRAALQDIPIVILTGHDDSALDSAALVAGAQDYLVKGQFGHNALGRAIRHALVRSALERELGRKNLELLKLHERVMDDLAVTSSVMNHIMSSAGLRDPQVRHFLRPTQQFSGDLIAAARDDGGNLRVMLADATGHGLQAAMFLLHAYRIFYAMAKKGLPICSIAAEINLYMRELAMPNHFIAAAIAYVSRDGSSLEIWNGGIPAVVYVQENGELHWFRSRHLPLGLAESGVIETDEEILQVAPGSLLLCSDGLTDAENFSGEQFGRKRLEALLRASPPSGLFDNILSALDAHLNGAAAHDDLSLAHIQCAATT